MCRLAAALNPAGHGQRGWHCLSNTSYPSSPVCGWQGVSCRGILVSKITLTSLGLNGTIPTIIEHLTALTYLELSDNSIRSSITRTLGKIYKLKFLDLSVNAFTGTVPSSLNGISSSAQLYLDTTTVTGSLPTSLCTVGLSSLTLYNSTLACYASCLSTVVDLSPGRLLGCNQSKSLLILLCS